MPRGRGGVRASEPDVEAAGRHMPVAGLQHLSWLSRQLSNVGAVAQRWQGAVLILLIAIGIARIASTYPVFSQTWDEPAHLAAGMEWLDRGSYRYEPLHPPLARVLTAVGPYLAGVRSARYANVWIEGNALLHAW